jgi:hypothetical protein
MKTITIAKDYSDTPLGRFPDDSDFNGTRFREQYLRPALEKGVVTVVIDGVEGYGSSFLEESFGGLVRKGYFTAEELKNKLRISFGDKDFGMYDRLIWKYIADARKETGG